MDYKEALENAEYTIKVGDKVIAKSDEPFSIEEVAQMFGYSAQIESIDASSLRILAMWLEGFVKGKGDSEPFGNQALKSLWKAVSYFQIESNINRAKSQKK